MTRRQNIANIVLGVCFETFFACLILGWGFFLCALIFFVFPAAP